ncbi:Hypothetical predicted protein [Pelobates cultripes]|uniref:Uncharacterized protein n=1 Tax=Pelobates cultripes TaxID=61616 RepID=A0AAD1SXR2_PELCU|nr:Hypothetical predicted protein [Pelobates cultripes]
MEQEGSTRSRKSLQGAERGSKEQEKSARSRKEQQGAGMDKRSTKVNEQNESEGAER